LPVDFFAKSNRTSHKPFRFSEGAQAGSLLNVVEFTVAGKSVWATSGTVTVTDSSPGGVDSVSFVLNVSTTGSSGSDGEFGMNFTGVDLISNGSVVNQENFNQLMNYPEGPFGADGSILGASTSITWKDDSAGGFTFKEYAGTVFAVPEPGSLICLAAFGCLGVMRRRRF